MKKQQQKVVDYYRSLESRLGYSFLTWDSKHFGYYPSKKRGIGERQAQTLTIELLAKKLKLNKSDLVLDAGCGRGTATCYLAKKYKAQILGIDIAPFELKKAKKLAQKYNFKRRVKFYLRDYSETGFSKSYFDKIFTLETIVHSPDLNKTLNEFHRILKPKGKLVLFEYSKSRPNEFTQEEKKIIELINDRSAMTSFNKMYHDTLTKYIEKAGFKIISDNDITKHMLPSLERFHQYAKIPYKIIKLLNLQKNFVNITAAVEFYRVAKKGLVKYRVVVAERT